MRRVLPAHSLAHGLRDLARPCTERCFVRVALREPRVAVGEILVAVVRRLKFTSIVGRIDEQFKATAHCDELATNPSYRIAVVLAEIGDRLEVRCKPPEQPDKSEIALSFALESAARLKPVEVPVDVQH